MTIIPHFDNRNLKNILDKRLMRKRAYFTSKNLMRPDIIYEDIGLIDCFRKYNFNVDNLVYNNSFMSKENGTVLYFEFNKKRIVSENT